MTPEGTEKFATYHRDATGLDYAMNRYYTSAWGRFLTADPYLAPRALTDPQGWNRYAYVENEPVNRFDPSGLDYCYWDGHVLRCGVNVVDRLPGLGWGLGISGASGASRLPIEPLIQDVPDEVAEEYDRAQWRRSIIDTTVSAAATRLTRTKCRDMFLGGKDVLPEHEPAEVLRGLNTAGAIRTIHSTHLQPADRNNPYIGGFNTGRNGLIYFIEDRWFFTGRIEHPDGRITMIGDTADFRGLTWAEVREVAMIHELLHNMGIVGSDNQNQQIRLPNGQVVFGSSGVTAAVRQNCF